MILTGAPTMRSARLGVADAVRARADAVVPRGEHHVLGGAADVEAARVAGDRDDEGRAEDVAGRVDGTARAPRGR